MSTRALTRANPFVPLSGFQRVSGPSLRPLGSSSPSSSYSTWRSAPTTFGSLPSFTSALRQSPLSQPARFPACLPFHPTSAPRPIQHALQRRFFGGGISMDLLASREEAANRNPTSAMAQNAFYQALLKANMPAIVVQRHQSGRFASNELTREAYHRALGMMSAASAGIPAVAGGTAPLDSISVSSDAAGGGAAAHSAAQLQAIGQAVAAHSRGASSASSKDTKGGPIHVVINESRAGNVFRWVKFVVIYGMFFYFTMSILTVVTESTVGFRKPGAGKNNSEVKPEKQSARFSDVHGCDEAKEEVQDLVEFLRDPERFSRLGGKMPKGVLLLGPPGTGKTLLARAVAGEAGVPFHYMSGSEFDEVYVGVGARRVRDLFAAAKAHSPSIIFIDEIDAVGSRRSGREQAYMKQTLNQLLTELDGFNQDTGVIVIGATNFPESLDKALTRPGRFDRHVIVSLPEVRGRMAILEHHAKKIKAAPNIDLKAIAGVTGGLSGADLENIVNQAAIHASKRKAEHVTLADFEWAKDQVIMGSERKSMVISPKEKEMTAYHEAGHALCSYYSKNKSQKLYKVTILPRGPSLGHTAFLPKMDKYSYSVEDYKATIERSLGGMLAEEIVYGTEMTTSGVGADLTNATATAYQMVARFGMSEKLGPLDYGDLYTNNTLSGQTKWMIEEEMKRTIREAKDRMRELLMSKRVELDRLAKALVEYETLDLREFEAVIRGEPLPDRVKIPSNQPMVVPAPASSDGRPREGVPSFPGPDRETEPGRAPPPQPPPPPPPAAAPTQSHP